MNAHFLSSVTSQPAPQSRFIAPSEELSDWRVKAVTVYADSVGAARTQLQRQFAERLLALTGCVASRETIALDCAGRSASAVVDGVWFLMRADDLMIVRPCAHCGTGRFVSEPLERQADLGYALAVWAPYHRDCEPVDPPSDVSW